MYSNTAAVVGTSSYILLDLAEIEDVQLLGDTDPIVSMQSSLINYFRMCASQAMGKAFPVKAL